MARVHLCALLPNLMALPALGPTPISRALFEDGQKLRALMDLRELESRLQEQRKGAGLEREWGGQVAVVTIR